MQIFKKLPHRILIWYDDMTVKSNIDDLFDDDEIKKRLTKNIPAIKPFGKNDCYLFRCLVSSFLDKKHTESIVMDVCINLLIKTTSSETNIIEQKQYLDYS